ncbi:MAG: RHS repeat-associated core domain-containing protein [Sulfurimonas sp.]
MKFFEKCFLFLLTFIVVAQANIAPLKSSFDLSSSEYGVRYYDPRTSVWQSPDPIIGEYMSGQTNGGVFNPKNLGLFTYTYNSPVNLVDPDGEATAVIFGLGTKNNPFGHIAIAFTGKGVHSSGTGTQANSSLTEYLKKQSSYRDSIVYIINTTPEQEEKMQTKAMEFVDANGKTKKLPNPQESFSEFKKSIGDNCSTRTEKIIEEGMSLGVDLVDGPTPIDTAAKVGEVADMEKSMYLKKGDPIPKKLESFNPKEGKTNE